MRVGAMVGVLVLAAVAVGQPKKLPDPLLQPKKPADPMPLPAKNDDGKYAGPKTEGGVAVLLDENLPPLIAAIYAATSGKDPSLTVDRDDVFAGLESLKQTGQELHAGNLTGWDFQFVETPKAANEFRYLRFAWKKEGGGSILLAFPQNGGWGGKRYVAGPYELGGSGRKVADAAPTEWTIVTRDVFKDFGPLHMSGVLFSSTSTGTTHWDMLLLGKTVEDLDVYTEAAVGKGKPKEPLTGKPRDAAWDDLMGDDRAKASVAFRKFLPVAAEQVSYIRDRIPKPVVPDEELPRRIAALVAQLGGEDFDARLAAEAALEKIGAKAAAQLKAEVGGGNAEVDYRAKRLLKKLGVVTEDIPPGQLRAARIARLLERANTKESRELLAKMSAGDFGPDYPAEAKAAQERMRRK